MYSLCEVFDSGNNIWIFIVSLCVLRVLVGIVFVENKIYVLGGKKNLWERIDKIECYDIELNEWRVVGFVFNCMGGI